MKEQLQALADELAEACSRHNRLYGNEVADLIGDVEHSYRALTTEIFHIPAIHRQYASALGPLSESLATYTQSMRWVGWGNCSLGPPLGIYPVEEYAHAIAAYISARLIDDAIDGHENYKGYMATSYGFLCAQMQEREAAGMGSMAGCALLHEVLLRLLKKEHGESAMILLSLYAEVIPGALAETFIHSRCSAELYNAVVSKKSVAYDMMLHRVFLRTAPEPLRTHLLGFLANFSETAQWLNDLLDADDDIERNQINFVHSIGIDLPTARTRIGSAFPALWSRARSMPPDIADALATRLRDPVATLVQVLP